MLLEASGPVLIFWPMFRFVVFLILRPENDKTNSKNILALFDCADGKSRRRFEWEVHEVFPAKTWLTVYRQRLVLLPGQTFYSNFPVSQT